MNRRTFLKATGLGGIAAAIGGIAYRVGGVWWDQTAAGKLKVLSVEEAQIVAAVADTLFPGESFPGGMPAATDVGIVEFFDDYLASIDVTTSRLLRLLLHAIDEGAIFSDFGATRFRFRPQAEREDILKGWHRSWFSARRGAFTSIVILLSMGYTEQPSVIAAAGFDYTCGDMEATDKRSYARSLPAGVPA